MKPLVLPSPGACAERRARVPASGVATRESLDGLLAAIRACRACEGALPLGPRPVVQAGAGARLLIVGQAPGTRVHASGIPWSDASGVRLRDWLGIGEAVFHDAARVAIMPMGYCYPGRGAGGDLPPRRECATLWHARLLAQLPAVRLTLLVGWHAQRHFLGERARGSLTETVAAHAAFAPSLVPLPHPSPRNTAWFQRHPWFADEVLPTLRARVREVLAR